MESSHLKDRLADFKNVGSTVFGPFMRVAGMRRHRGTDLEERLQRLEDEADIRDAFGRYHYYYDAGEADAIADLFAEDAILVNPRGTYAGRDAIRANYAFLIERPGPVFHYATNVMVRRHEDNPDRASLTAFLWVVYTAAHPDTAEPRTGMGGGTYAIEWCRTNGDWLMSKSRLTLNYRLAGVQPEIGKAAVPPPPSLPEGSAEWMAGDPELEWPSSWS